MLEESGCRGAVGPIQFLTPSVDILIQGELLRHSVRYSVSSLKTPCRLCKSSALEGHRAVISIVYCTYTFCIPYLRASMRQFSSKQRFNLVVQFLLCSRHPFPSGSQAGIHYLGTSPSPSIPICRVGRTDVEILHNAMRAKANAQAAASSSGLGI